MNVPDDWHVYWQTCNLCGYRYHASEGGCDCLERRTEELAAAIGEELPELAGELAVECPVVELSHALSDRLGYLMDGGMVSPEAIAMRTVLFAGLRRAGQRCGVELEVCAHDSDAGESWTVEIMSTAPGVYCD